MRILAQNCIHSAKLGIFALFATLGPKGHLLRKSALLRPHAADAYKTNGILTKTEPFLAQKRFWAQKCILGPKKRFGSKNAKMTQNPEKRHKKVILSKKSDFCDFDQI